MLNQIFIPFNTASSKNSKRIVSRGKKTFLISSQNALSYKTLTKPFWIKHKNQFLEMIKGKSKPYKIGFYFIRDSKRKSDYANIVQSPLDLMQEHGWIDNDDMSTVIPVFTGYEVNKENAGLIITVL